MHARRINLLDPELYAQGLPLDTYDWLRDNAPVYWHEEPDGGPGFWVLTGLDTVRSVGRSPKAFASRPTTMIPDGATMGDEVHRNLIFNDPPEHAAQRRVIVEDFLPKAAKALEPRIERIASDLLDEVEARGSCDLVEDLAGVLASYVIAELLGIPHEDGKRLYYLTEVIQRGISLSEGEGLAAVQEMFGYAHSVWESRRATPTGDLPSRIAHGHIGDREIDEMDFNLYFLLLINAGGDTSRNVIGGGMAELLRHPDQVKDLRENVDELLPGAVEEMLRWVCPIIYQRRTATAPAVVGGQQIEAGQKVVMFYAAANFDPKVFDRPREFAIRRSPNPHISFGAAGPHHCLGAHVARIEIAAMVRALLRRFPTLELDGPLVWSSSTIMNGPTNVPIRFRR